MQLSLRFCLPVIGMLLAASTAVAVERSSIVEQHGCFERFPTYDTWMEYLWQKNNVFGYFVLRRRYPELEFERHQRSVDCRYIRYVSDEYVVPGFIVLPRQHRPGQRFPVVIFNRGGNRQLGALAMPELLDYVFPLAEQGFVVMASQYRGVLHVPDAQPSPDQFGGDDVGDVTHMIELAAQIPEADTTNIFMLGQSRGAIMTFRALLDSPMPVRAVAVHSGAYDMYDMLAFRPEFESLFRALIPGYEANRRSELDRRSVTRWAEQLPEDTGILIVHGDEDERAPLGSARKLDRELERLGRRHELVVLEGEGHSLAGMTDAVRDRTVAWFRAFEVEPGKPSTPSP